MSDTATIQGRDRPVSGVLTEGEVCLLDCLHNARYELRQLMQRWDDRLALENLSFVEKYIEGRIALLCDFDVGRGSYQVKFSAMSDGNCSKVKGISAFVGHINVSNRSNGNDWDQQPMFVHDVQIVHGIQDIIPSLVRLYRVNDKINDSRRRSLYFSTIDGCYKLIPVGLERKIDVSVGHVASQGYDFAGHEVEGGAEIVNSITHYQGDFAGHISGGLKLEDIQSVLRIFLDVKSIEVRIEKGLKDGIKLADVLIGPFDL